MTRYTTSAALFAAFLIIGQAQGSPGPAPTGTAIAEYDWSTGEIIVSVNAVNNWYVESSSHSLTGADPVGLPAGGGLLSNGDNIIGESTPPGLLMTYTDLNLGPVAATGLNPNLVENTIPDLNIWWNSVLGEPTMSQPVALAAGSFPGNAPPTANLNGPFSVNVLSDPLNITLDASGSTDDGFLSPLTYTWDLDNDGTFDIDTGNTSTFEIADVTTTFGGLGTYEVSVEVFDGEFADVASTTVDIFSETPPPPPLGPVYAQYDPVTGQIVVTVNNVINWYIESTSHSLTGDDPMNLPAAGGAVSDNDQIIGETTGFFKMTYENVNLGNVAEPGLPPGDLIIGWNTDLSSPLSTQPLNYVRIPEPTSLALAALTLCGVMTICRRFT